MPHRFVLPRPATFVSVAVGYAIVMLGGTIPIPLWDIWAHRLMFGPFTVTLAFGLYAVGTMTALTAFRQTTTSFRPGHDRWAITS